MLSSVYTDSVRPSTAVMTTLPQALREVADGSLAGALAVAQRFGAQCEGPAKAARVAFTQGMWFGLLAFAGIVAAGIISVAAIRHR